LFETEQYFTQRRFNYTRQELLEIYMIFGGNPYYYNLFMLNYLQSENIDRLLFNEKSILKKEYNELTLSVFDEKANFTKIIQLLYDSNRGLTREEIIKSLDSSSGGTLSDDLDCLVNIGYIRQYVSLPKTQLVYRLVDFFLLFYHFFQKEIDSSIRQFWTINQVKNSINQWKGYAFERVCFSHINEIKQRLGVLDIPITVSTLHTREAQIDLILNREDSYSYICEVKYSNHDYEYSLDEKNKMDKRMLIFSELTKRTPISTIIVNNDINKTLYYKHIIKTIRLDDLFKEVIY
jgi:hypothetical protein